MTSSRIRLLLLDFDGTLADTRRANTLAYVQTLREAGYPLTEEEYEKRYFGMRCNEFLTHFGIADPTERERLRLRKIALYPRFFDTVRLNRPLWEFCRQFRAGGGAYGSSRPEAAPTSRTSWLIWASAWRPATAERTQRSPALRESTPLRRTASRRLRIVVRTKGWWTDYCRAPTSHAANRLRTVF